jgi:hypothetical protein
MEPVIIPEKPQLRQQLWRILHEGKGRLGHAFNFALVILILLSVAIVPLELLPNYREFSEIIGIIEAVIIALFTFEYVLRIYSAPNRLRYIFSFFGIIDLLSIIPFYAGIFGTPFIRVLRLIRLVKIGAIDSPGGLEDSDQMERGIGLMQNEQVEYVVTKHPLFLFIGTIPPVLAASFALGVLFVWNGNPIAISFAVLLLLFAFVLLLKTWLDFSYDVIYLTNYRLIFHDQHLLGRSINQMSYGAITNVKPFYPSMISYIFRYGTLVIDTAAEHTEKVSITMVRHHEQAAHVIMQRAFAGNAPAVSFS